NLSSFRLGDEMTRIARVRLEHQHGHDTLGIGTARPRLSWIVETTQTDWRQVAYEMEARGHEVKPGGKPIASDESVLVPWPFAPLSSRERLTVRVRVWGTHAEPSEWSEPYPVEAGLLDANDWSAR